MKGDVINKMKERVRKMTCDPDASDRKTGAEVDPAPRHVDLERLAAHDHPRLHGPNLAHSHPFASPRSTLAFTQMGVPETTHGLREKLQEELRQAQERARALEQRLAPASVHPSAPPPPYAQPPPYAGGRRQLAPLDFPS